MRDLKKASKSNVQVNEPVSDYCPNCGSRFYDGLCCYECGKYEDRQEYALMVSNGDDTIWITPLSNIREMVKVMDIVVSNKIKKFEKKKRFVIFEYDVDRTWILERDVDSSNFYTIRGKSIEKALEDGILLKKLDLEILK